ncbi:type II CRISPR RNA-guided endonuclease Cas9 [Chryseobacterium potabilaquae]|uniref:CRISPR-associated endonuclease Cas9 1 n=1 Tax=Chryseobacterium potabilaquae TaxID=2675057 RepID=A0A6N4XA11_9FLAO|nr:type II CRISPR RNA-guided endonuclease Cas9 [Chryseobacterium potabilaquae]CAA7197615.1 CRISPR-associated endonuclease Cas9 1 [Chryseobacterium potabilaquae]
MSKVLGIDLGTNSIGWAIRNTDLAENQIEDFGVITFEKGVASEKGNEFPKVQKRTQSRGKRRNYQAEKYRKFALLDFLIEKDMCPLTREEFNNWKLYKKGKRKEYPQSEVFLNWIRFDFDGDGLPDFHLFGKNKDESYYIFRAFSVDEKYKNIFADNSHILGRVFYQLVQRRGFKGKDEEESKTILEGSKDGNTKGRDSIEEYLEKYKTLGAALYNYQKDFGGRIRQRYNLRKDFEFELQEICKVHQISPSDYKKLWKAIIWQRPLRTQKELIGNCIYEKNKKRIAVSHPLYEEYRTWTFINNLNIVVPFGEDQQDYLSEKIYPLFYKSKPDFELIDIDKQLKKDGGKRQSKHNEKTKVLSVKLLKQFQDIFGEDWKKLLKWDVIGNRDSQPIKRDNATYTFEDLWHVLFTFDGQENLKKFALEKLNLDEEKATKFSRIKLQQGYATLSLSAIKKILPYLQKGFLYNHSVYMANLHKMLNENTISESLINYFADEISRILKDDSFNRKNAAVINGLISEMLNDENRYYISDGRNLDEREKETVFKGVINHYGLETWDRFSEPMKTEIIDFISAKYLEFLKKTYTQKGNLFVQQERIHDQIFTFLQETYNVPEDKKKYLWHPSEQENYIVAEEYQEFSIGNKKYYVKEQNYENFLDKNSNAESEAKRIKLLGDPQPLSKGFKNPMALKSLYKLKSLINYLLQIGKIDEYTKVVVEIARELNDKNKRKAIQIWQKDRENQNEAYKKELEAYRQAFPNINLIDENTLIRKIRLWHEQNKICLYTGKPISFTDLIIGNKYDFEHTIPASISFDNDLKNLTISDSTYNRVYKGRKFPTQLPNYESEQKIDGKIYNSIIRNIEFIFGERTVENKEIKGKNEEIVKWKKIDELEKQYDEWKKKASYASTKEIKDNCIIKYHTIKMDLDYLKSKLASFTITEYKAGWRNNQIRDTQMITKYALPYLKTLFRKVSVEKGAVTDIFKKVYKVQSKEEKKDRSIHSHHAQDAAILTLIPNAFHRERIIKAYENEIDNRTGKTYHEIPMDWKNFSEKYIMELKDKIIINNLTDNRTITQTYKTVRKRGKIIYDIDKEGNSSKRISRGDTIRGQLHGETFYGAIKQPLRDEENKILFDEDKKMILKEEVYLVIRKPLVYKKDANSPGFKTLEEVEKLIVDRALFEMIKIQVKESDFKTALTDGVYMLDENGNKVNKIRRIRCFEKGLKYTTAIKIHKHSFTSNKKYKEATLVTNGENTYCLFYKNDQGKAMRILSIVDVANLKLKNIQTLYSEPEFLSFESGKGKKKIQIPLYSILKSGDKVLFYKDNKYELKDLEQTDLVKRMFKIYQFEKDGRIKFRHHLVAGIDTELKKSHQEYSTINFEDNPVFLRLSQAQWNFAIQDKDFEVSLDGKIHWKF